MAEIRCPMCGKPNPDEQDVCQFCEARLKPLRLQSPQNEEGGKLPEWFERDQNDEQDTEDPQSIEDVEDSQGWLDLIRSDSETEDEPSQEMESEPALDEDESTEADEDWMQRFRSLHDADQVDEAEPFETQPDGSSIDGSISAPHSDATTEDDDLVADVNDSPEWLDRLHDLRGTDDDSQSIDEAESDESDSTDSPSPEEVEPAVEGEIPDWFTRPPSDEPEAEPELEGQDEGASDWLSELGIEDATTAPEEAEPAVEGEFPDWISGTPQDETEAETELEGQDEGASDWLSELGIEYETATSEEAEPAIAEEIPDWMTATSQDELKAKPALPGQEQDTPDWLSTLGESGRFPAADAESEPEWLSESGDDGIFATQPPQRPGAQTPDWLSDSGEGSEPGEQEITDWLSVTDEDKEPVSAEDEDLQSWFSELDQDTELSGEPAPRSAVSETGEDMPGWLKKLGSVVTGTVEDDNIPDEKDGAVSPFVGQEKFDDDLLDVESLPEWLTPEPDLPDDREEIEVDSGLTPAELPGWLAAMRPVDLKGSKEPLDEGLVESAGPLAGLRSVLPVEPEITRFTKPPVYSAKLQVTRSQQAHADLFHKMLSAEGEVEPLPPSPLISSQRALRWVIALILMIAIGIFVIGEGEFVPLPGNAAIPDATYASSKIIGALPDRAPVLIAFDYEPGIAGEMNAAAAALVDHLMLKGARLSLVSTLPTGPALAEYFIQTVQSQHGYTKGLQYVNLGYIPGGAAGLLSFAQTPKWVFPLSYNGFSPWETQPLRGVDSLSDYALVVVITEDPEDARAWIEQVQPRIGDTPMLTVVSAQAEPMVRPYFGSDQNAQVKGIVSGLSGGAAYEVTVGRTNLGRTYWDAFSIGLLIALGAILIGGLVNVVQLLFARNNNDARGKSS